MSPRFFQSPRGTSDILPDQQRHWRTFESRAEEVAVRFGYERIDTPTIEDAQLFVRGVGEVTDIVEKETYTFEDRGGDLITLRPEGTAPVCRAYLEHGMHNLPQPVRMYYMGRFFRYERPQAGRYREFRQFGIEVIGDSDASVDAEVIEFAWRLLEALDVTRVSLLLNSTGDAECRPGYIERLQSYYRRRLDEVTHPECRRRLEANPLRLLDCKEASCQPIIAGAPDSIEHLCAACAEHWNGLLEQLGALGLSYEVDKRLVRGFDYYTRTVFELGPPGAGSQSTILAGGRYDGLVEVLGGRPTPGIGFALGIDRVLENLRRQEAAPADVGPKVLVAHVGESSKMAGVTLSAELRRSGVTTVLAPSGRSLKSQLRYASSIKATHAVIIGDQELSKGTVILRDLTRSQQREVSPDDLPRLFLQT